MPEFKTKVKPKSEDSFESIITEATLGIIDDIEREVDIVTFCEHPFYLDQSLHGVEKLILKAFYGLPLDDSDEYLQIRSYPFDAKGKMFTEIGFVKYLMEQGRTNIINPKDIQAAIELILVCGRRSGKTFIASVISAYEAYKLIIKGDPQKYYKLPRGEEIRIINIATSGEQALILAQATQNRILNSRWFIPYIEGKNESTIRLRTKHDLQLLKEEKRNHGKALDHHASIKVEALSCTARRIRGGSIIVGILDELAHFIDNDGNRSGGQIYEALTPSIATFGMDGKILSMSSPYTKSGILFDLYLNAKGRSETDTGDKNKLFFQLPTWEMNETISFNYFDSEKKRNPDAFITEIGAEFSTIISGFIKYPEKIDACIKRENEILNPTGSFSYYLAADPANTQHGYALALVHVEHRKLLVKENDTETYKDEQVVVLDRWKVWTLRDSEFEGLEYIDEEVIEEYIEGLLTKFKIVKIVYDQFESSGSINKFRKMGLNAEKTPFSRSYNVKIYSKLRNLIYEGKLDLFKHERGIMELKNLQERRVGRRQFIVEAPTQGEITTDDLCDVLANACYIASEAEITKTAPMIMGTNGYQAFYGSDKNKRLESFQAYKHRLIQHRYAGNFERAKQMGLVRR